MSSLAIPAAPPSAATNPGNGAAPAAGGEHFGDTLRKTQSGPEAQAHGGTAGDAAAPGHAGHKPDAGKQDAAKNGEHTDEHTDKRAGKQADAKADDRPADTPNALPVAIAAVPLAPATVRQAPAASGKPLPAAATPSPLAATGAAKAAPAPATSAATTPEAGIAPTALPDAHLAAATAQTPGLAVGAHSGTDGGKDAMPARLDPNHFTAHLGQLIGAHQAPAPTPTPAPVQLAMQATPQQQPQFAQETAQHISWLAGKGIDKAEIQLNPSKLGPISIEITNHHDRVDVSFAVQHPQTVHALQQTLPQLHDMLAQQGLNLGQASVGQQSHGQQHAAFAQHAAGGNGHGNDAGTDTDMPLAPRTLHIAAPGRVDDFA